MARYISFIFPVVKGIHNFKIAISHIKTVSYNLEPPWVLLIRKDNQVMRFEPLSQSPQSMYWDIENFKNSEDRTKEHSELELWIKYHNSDV